MSSADSPEHIMRVAWGFAPPLIVEVAIRNRVFDFLDTAAHSVDEVAEFANGSIRGWRAILNCLVGLGFLAKTNGRYRTTPESSTYLVTTKPAYVGGFFRHISKQLLPSWLNLEEIVRTGTPAARGRDRTEAEIFFCGFRG